MIATTLNNLGALTKMDIGVKDAVYFIGLGFGFGTIITMLRSGLKNLNEKVHDLTEQIKKQNGRVTKNSENAVKHIVDFHTEKK